MRPALFLVCLCLSTLVHAVQRLPSFEQVRAEHQSSEARLLDRHGAPLAERRLRHDSWQLEWVSLDVLAPAMKEALLEAEDRRFYQHEGIDWRAFAAAAVQNLWFEHARGASTLTMQLAGLLDPALRPGGGGARRSLEQKWDQAFAAQALESDWTKAQILEAYLNLAPFRGPLRGVAAAAWALIGKGPEALDRAEAAVLVALLRAPNAPHDKVAWRACELVARIGSPEACARAKALVGAMDPVRLPPRWDDAPHLARRLLAAPGTQVRTVLERGWQRRLVEALAAGAPSRAAAVVLDNASGAVLAEVGGLDAAHADESRVPRPAGRMLWPLAAALAIDARSLTAATLLDGGASVPERWLSLRSVLHEANAAAFADLLARLDAPAATSVAFATLGVAQAGDPVAAWQDADLDLPTLAAVARALAVDGRWIAPYWIAELRAPARPLVSQGAAFIATDLMPALSAAWVNPAAAWAVGSNEAVTVAVWMASGPASLIEVRTWLESLLAAGGRWPAERVVPAGVVSRTVRFDPPVEPPRTEWFLKGTVQPLFAPPRLRARIVHPVARSIVDRGDLDAAGALTLRAAPPDARLRWRVDGRPLGSGATLRWLPEAGARRIELLDERGAVLDAVDIAVRGGGS